MADEIDKDAQHTHQLTAEVARALIARGWRLTTAESCTGGNLAAALCAQADTAAFMIPAWLPSAMKPSAMCCRCARKPRRNTALSAKRA